MVKIIRPILGQILLKNGIITEHQLNDALEKQKKSGHWLGMTLVRLGYISDEQVLMPFLAQKLGVQLAHIKASTVPPDVIGRISAKVVHHYKVFPVKFQDGKLFVAMSDPTDVTVLDDLATIAHAQICPMLAGEKEIQEAIRDYYGVGAETIEKMMTNTEMAQPDEVVIEDIDEEGPEASISRFFNQILFAAYKDHATDIHIEPFDNELCVRYRIDGVLYDVTVPGNIHLFSDEIISRIKVLANLNIAEKRLPQDGRFKVRVKDQDLDLRVTFLPTPFGESAVIRILNSTKLYSFDELGFRDQERAHLDRLLAKSHGIIFITGPTGSGKTTTLYSCLSVLNKESSKIVTIEDPIEYQLKGAVQVQVHNEIGLHFATALRSMLRNDPDIMMVGEVRDQETSRITIQAALTGHLVFSTLHTNDAASGVARLMDMGIEPYLIASAVQCFIAQRLVRVVCPHCRVPVQLTAAMVNGFDVPFEQVKSLTVYEAKGCKLCRMTGYLGRIAIGEFLILDDEIRLMITGKASVEEIKNKAISKGMKTLRRHGWEKIIAGSTTIGEVLRVTGED
ncbi:MAG: ATPase, T2SS/T4P/T4SS family [Candidatus Omnitrophota bacterium]